jgi:hypothetical protein
MNNEALKQLGIGQVATMFGIAAVAGQFAEALVGKEVLSVAEAQTVLTKIAEELRNDGDKENGKYAKPAYMIANQIDQRAIALKAKFCRDGLISTSLFWFSRCNGRWWRAAIVFYFPLWAGEQIGVDYTTAGASVLGEKLQGRGLVKRLRRSRRGPGCNARDESLTKCRS